MERTSRDDEGGFTMLEIMIVLAIIGLIASSVGVAVFRNYRDGQRKTAQLQVREVLGGAAQFMINKSRCPTVDELVADQYLRRPPIDPWGVPIEIRCPGEHGADPADVISSGPDRQKDTADDIKSWEL